MVIAIQSRPMKKAYQLQTDGKPMNERPDEHAEQQNADDGRDLVGRRFTHVSTIDESAHSAIGDGYQQHNDPRGKVFPETLTIRDSDEAALEDLNGFSRCRLWQMPPTKL